MTKRPKVPKCDYSDRRWLEEASSGSTGAIQAYKGTIVCKAKTYEQLYLRLSDCSNAIQLHVVNDDTDAFISKLRMIENVCNKFANMLEMPKLAKNAEKKFATSPEISKPDKKRKPKEKK